jgi:hypothetical protein
LIHIDIMPDCFYINHATFISLLTKTLGLLLNHHCDTLQLSAVVCYWFLWFTLGSTYVFCFLVLFLVHPSQLPAHVGQHLCPFLLLFTAPKSLVKLDPYQSNAWHRLRESRYAESIPKIVYVCVNSAC